MPAPVQGVVKRSICSSGSTAIGTGCSSSKRQIASLLFATKAR
jgi:hypothetical protein